MFQKVNSNNGGITNASGASSRGEMRQVPVLLDVPAGVPASSIVLPAKRSTPAAFDIILTGGGGATGATYAVLFDPYSWVKTNMGLAAASDGVTVTGSSAAYAPMAAQVAATPLYIVAINYKTNQQHRTIKFLRYDFDGSQKIDSLVPSAAERNTQQQTNLLTLSVNQFIDSYTGIQVMVGTNETVHLTFILGARANALS